MHRYEVIFQDRKPAEISLSTNDPLIVDRALRQRYWEYKIRSINYVGKG